MSVNNARGVLEAMFNKQSEFTRTPKYGSSDGPTRATARKVRYLPVKSLLPFVELLFAVYFAFCMWHAVRQGAWMSLPFLLMFLGGFLYVSAKSFLFWLRQWGAFRCRRAPSRLEEVSMDNGGALLLLLAGCVQDNRHRVIISTTTRRWWCFRTV